MIDWLQWYRIVDDRRARIVLVANAAEDAFWILDARDSPIYTIHDAGHSFAEASAYFDCQLADADALDAIGCIPVDHVQFDATQLKLMGPPIT